MSASVSNLSPGQESENLNICAKRSVTLRRRSSRTQNVTLVSCSLHLKLKDSTKYEEEDEDLLLCESHKLSLLVRFYLFPDKTLLLWFTSIRLVVSSQTKVLQV